MWNVALAEIAAGGISSGTYFASPEARLARVAALAPHASTELVAKTAVHCRERGRMNDVPAFLVAHLATRDVALMSRVFPRVIDDGRMLRSFVQIVRSGVTGRKSFGSAPKRALRTWFQGRTPDAIFRQSIGQSPSMSDVIKMVRPPPRNDKGEADAVREALYGYLIGKSVDWFSLPPLAKAFEAFKDGAGPMPDVPFEMLTALPLRAEHWTSLAEKMTFSELRSNLDTLLWHGVLRDDALVDSIAARLSDGDAIRRARVMPCRMAAALRSAESNSKMPRAIVNALATGFVHALANVPSIEGRVSVITDHRSDVTELVSMTLGSIDRANADVFVFVSNHDAKTIAEQRAPREGAKIVLIDLETTDLPVPAHDNVLHVAGFSDDALDVIVRFANGDAGNDAWLSVVDGVTL